MDVVYSNAETVQPEPAFEMRKTQEKTKDPANVIENGIVQPNDEGRDEGRGSISFHNISYMVEQRICLKKRPPKIILDNVRSELIYCVISTWWM